MLSADEFASIPPPVLRKFKLVFLGEQNVGKTALIARFMYDNFDSNYQATIGIDFLSKNIYLDEATVKLQLWDTAGQERFRSLIPSYIRDSSGAIVVYDITDRRSFTETRRWVKEVRAERGSDVIIMLVGNKVDLGDSRRQVTAKEGQEQATEIGAHFIETSAKTSYNVRELFRGLAARLTTAGNFDNGTKLISDLPLRLIPKPDLNGVSGGGSDVVDLEKETFTKTGNNNRNSGYCSC